MHILSSSVEFTISLLRIYSMYVSKEVVNKVVLTSSRLVAWTAFGGLLPRVDRTPNHIA
jgi:hypothetical protein